MAYTPPTSPLVINFVGPYAPPTSPLAINFVSGADQYLTPVGADSAAFGSATAVYTQYGVVSGSDFLLFGGASIAYPPEPPSSRTLFASGISAPPMLQAPRIENYLRYILAGDIQSLEMPNPAIGYRVRSITTPWIASMQFGSAMLGRSRSLEPAGFDALLFGDPEARDNRQTADAYGLNDGDVSAPAIGYRVRPLGVGLVNVPDEFRIGSPLINNSTQFVRPEYVADHWQEGAPGLPYIVNRNRVIDLVLNSVRPPFRQVPYGVQIDNAARLVGPSGFDAPVFGAHQAADFIRSFQMEGWDSFGSDRYAVVFNRADVLSPGGFVGDSFGTAYLENTRRTLPPSSAGETSSFGIAFIADAVRTLTPWGDFVAYPISETHMAEYANRTIEPLSLDWPFSGAAFGIAQLDIMDRRLRAPGILSRPSVFGESRIQNVTRQVYPYWDSSSFTPFGSGRIINRTAEYYVEGVASEFFARPQIADRRQYLGAPGFSVDRWGIHTIRNDTPDPPARQVVEPDGNNFLLVPLPTVKANSIFPTWLIEESDRYGVAKIAVNSLKPKGIPAYFDPDTGGQFGLPALNDNQYVFGTSIDAPNTGRPSMSPLTIWAPSEAPEQAIINHPTPSPPHAIDAFANKQMLPVISNRNRSISIQPIGSPAFSFDHAVSRNPETIFPQGVTSLKMGFPEIRNANELAPRSMFTEIVSEPAVAPVIEYTGIVQPNSWESFLMGGNNADNKDRPITTLGFHLENNFGVTLVQRPPPPAEPEGQVFSEFGQTMISHRIRDYQMSGWDSFVCTFRPGEFAARMRVYRRNYISPPTLADAALFGQTSIGPRPVGSIRPPGIETWPMQIYHGVFHA